MRRYALLVATSDYFDPRLRGLRTTEEARELKELLAEQDIGGYDTVHVLVNETKAAIERGIEEHFRKCEPNDVVLLYIAGHGIKNDDNQLFFAAGNTDVTLPYSTAVPAQIVHRMITECEAGSKAIVLDCCYSGVFNEGSVPRSGDSLNLEEQLGGGLFTMTATNEIEYAYENQRPMENRPQPGSTFTSAIIEAMRSGLPDTDRDGVMTFNELYTFVHKRVTEEGRQTPTRGGNQHGDMIFSWVRGARFAIPKLPPLRLGELLHERPKGFDATSPVPIGRTHESDRHPAEHVGLDLVGGRHGHVAVVGRIHSGKSTLLQTTILSLTATSGADQVQFKCLDGDGRLAGLSQVVSAGHTPEAAAALLGEVEELIDRRRELFASGIPNIHRFRRLRRERPDRLPGSDHAETFLIIDGWAWFESQVPDLPAAVHRIASAGLTFGVHVIITARSWSELPDELVDLLQGRVELSLQDPAESKLDPERAADLPANGWALHEEHTFQVAQPHFDEPVDDITELLTALADESEQAPAPLPAPPSPTAPLGLFPLLGRPDVTTFDPSAAWRPGPVEERYRAVIGSWDDTPITLDLKESASGGMGPHGLCVGAAGSGKSEFLRTLVLSLMATHSPEEINFVLVDWTGRGTFADFQEAPHVAGIIPGLRDDPQLVDRMRDVLSGEIQRRQTLLNEVRARNVWEYREQRVQQDLPPLPMLFVVIDEFTELLHEQPDLADLFVMIGRMGRSLQVQLLLSGRRVEESMLRGLEGHLTYRIGLRTSNAADSRAAIGVPDAAELPETGGHGYLRHAAGVIRFRSAYVSSPVPGDPRVAAESRSELRFAVRRMRGTGPTARPIWLPPLGEPPVLERLLPLPAERRHGPRLHAPIGVIDVPFEHKQEPMRADLSGGSGHVAIVGAPGSGKSVAVRTLLLSLAHTHTPEEVQFYCIDLGGGGLHAVRDLPHVGAVSGRGAPDVLRRTIAELRSLLAAREARFIDRGIDSMATYRDQRRRGEGSDDDPYGDVFLILDGWAALQNEFDGADRDVVNLASQGLGFGLHVVVTADRWSEIRPALKDLLGTRLELRLAEPAESEIDRETADRVPIGRPGRGLHPSKLHMLTALPRTGDVEGDAEAGVAELAAKLRDAWHGARAPKVRLLPQHLPYGQLPVAERQPRPSLVPIGINEDGIEPIYLDFRSEPHFYAFGEGAAGKTSLLRTVIRGVTTRYTPHQAMIVLVDVRRGLLGFPQRRYLMEHAVSTDQLRSAVRDVAATLRGRLPGSDAARERPHARRWSGPELFVVVDDYELVSAPGDNALAPLAEFITQASAVGLHLVLARDSANANRALHDPIIGKMREVSTPALLMSAAPHEGRLIGNVPAAALPPGRGTLISRSLRSGPQLIQTAHISPD
ncbi:type VII secretion protein EccCb [Saccharopolyspora gloriosae]|uniref:type VII secretion protein EccCb n=1 Tax=Saccharopolyspora gloriosae TaxID=455344 RepID=UPI001FB5B525|nr:type VII secretion protein EccCb [Saccharopolyspora gloriosae]